MPPKDGGGKKQQEKKKAKIVEDRTFGLKNKNKSKKVQNYVKSVEVGVAMAGISAAQRKEQERLKAAKEALKAGKEAAEMEKAALFRTVVNKTVVPQGVDSKSVLCEFFKVGKCKRGAACKFSHDMEITRKVAKIDIYSDPRHLDTIDKWDAEKLADVVNKKQAKGKLPPTDKICKYFLDAIENSVYGWFWECPSGVDCHYRHCLPQGYVLKTKADKEREKNGEEDEEEQTLEEKIDEQRKQLDLSKCTPITLELFTKWKKEKEARRIAEVETKRVAAEKKSAGSGLNVMSGRDLFRFDPSLFVDDEEADEDEYTIDEDYQPETKEDEEDDLNAANYDVNAESGEEEEEEEEDDGEERKGDGGEEEDDDENGDEEDEDNEEEESKSVATVASASSSSSVAKAASAIDKSLYLDDDVPDE